MARVLIVDDEREVVMMLQFTLQSVGHEISVAFSGVEALQRLGVEPADPTLPLPDIVVMDVRMPELDGLSTAARMAASPRAKKVPIILLSGDGGESRPVMARLPNIVGRIDKPFEPKTLRQMIADKLPPAAAAS